jgi:hypothetical protein
MGVLNVTDQTETEIRELDADEVEMIAGGKVIWVNGTPIETDFDREK